MSSGNRPKKKGQYIDSIDLPAVHQPAQEVITVASDPGDIRPSSTKISGV